MLDCGWFLWRAHRLTMSRTSTSLRFNVSTRSCAIPSLPMRLIPHAAEVIVSLVSPISIKPNQRSIYRQCECSVLVHNISLACSLSLYTQTFNTSPCHCVSTPSLCGLHGNSRSRPRYRRRWTSASRCLAWCKVVLVVHSNVSPRYLRQR